MRKLFVILFAFFVLFFNTNALFAADNDYKNNLLKIEVVKVDEENYDIGLYTQKIYNEPVKVVKKSDTTYYLLLPETSHSITSVPVVGSIKSVMVKSYPYAGQDLNNGYTKVAIITSKPLNITTSLRTLDTSVSPRLDPIRLARLDKVFERYSERLAENNIPTPLSEFRKTNVAQRPTIQSNVEVKNDDTDVIALEPKTKPIEEIKPTVQEKVEVKPVVQPATKPQPVQVAIKPQVKPVVQQKPVVATKPIVAQSQAKPVVKEEKPTVIAQTVQPAVKPTQNVEAKKETAQTNTVEQFEKQLPTTKPTEVEFNKKVPVDIEGKKEISAEILEPIEKAIEETNKEQEKTEVKPNVVVNTTPIQLPKKESDNLMLILASVFVILFFVYVQKRKFRVKKTALNNRQGAVQETNDIKELLRNRTAIKRKDSEEEVVEENEIQENIQEQVEEAPVVEEVTITMDEEEAAKVQAFNAYMDSVQEDEEFEEEAVETPIVNAQSEDDEVLRQLYTPIQNQYAYVEENELAEYEEEQETEEEVVDNDVATIMSASKLTETRGLYLAKFEGSTSLVGYIQDDIYVLYNFGDVELDETEIESRLAQENDTDSLYIVKTGGKKLMVKSTPYDLSLEMVM